MKSKRMSIVIFVCNLVVIMATTACATKSPNQPIEPNLFYVVRITPDKGRPVLGGPKIEKHVSGTVAKSKARMCDNWLYKGFVIEIYEETTLKPSGGSPYVCDGGLGY